MSRCWKLGLRQGLAVRYSEQRSLDIEWRPAAHSLKQSVAPPHRKSSPRRVGIAIKHTFIEGAPHAACGTPKRLGTMPRSEGGGPVARSERRVLEFLQCTRLDLHRCRLGREPALFAREGILAKTLLLGKHLLKADLHEVRQRELALIPSCARSPESQPPARRARPWRPWARHPSARPGGQAAWSC